MRNIETYSEEAKNWARTVLNKKDDDYATSLYLAHFASHTPLVPNKLQLARYELAREILEQNIWQKPFTQANRVAGIPKNIWIKKVEIAIRNNKYIPKETINEYNLIK